MPVDSTNAIPSSTSRSDLLGRPVRPCTAGRRGGISGSTSAHNSSLISRGGGEETDDDMPPQPRPAQNPTRPDTPDPHPSTSATSSNSIATRPAVIAGEP